MRGNVVIECGIMGSYKRFCLQYASVIDTEMVLRVYPMRREGKRNKRVERGGQLGQLGQLDHVIARGELHLNLQLRTRY